jgi:uncharacterized protein (DUF885 family)
MILLLSCLHRPSELPLSPALHPEATAGVADPALAALLSEHWEDALRRAPEFATRLGDHRYDELLSPTGPAAAAEARATRDRMLAVARDLRPGSAEDQLTLELLIDQLETDQQLDVCRAETWEVSARMNPLVDLEYLAELQPVEDPAAARSLARRYLGAPAYVQGVMDNLRLGLREGRSPSRGSAEKLSTQLHQWLEQPCEQTALLQPLRQPQRWGAEGPAIEAELRAGAAQVCAAVRSFSEMVDAELLPAARPEGAAGVSHLPGGPACYAARIRSQTSLQLSAEQIHQAGLVELERIHAEMRQLGGEALGSRDLPEIFARLRGDRALYFQSAEEVEAAAEGALRRAEAAVPRVIGRLPRARCVVKPIPEHEAPWTTIAYYRPGVPDGSSPGEYRINLYQPETRPRFEAEALAFHESVPGHHLQISIAQELPALPAFRKHSLYNAYVEGWALYTERLADELSLYSGALDRMGMLSFDAWRASRLVVDTGLHAQGWSRERAIRFMLDHTALTPSNVENEVDRYISWPGQALGYKLGQLELLRMRREAETALGPRFSLSDWHDAVLGAGPLPLPVLGRRMEAWVQARR